MPALSKQEILEMEKTNDKAKKRIANMNYGKGIKAGKHEGMVKGTWLGVLFGILGTILVLGLVVVLVYFLWFNKNYDINKKESTEPTTFVKADLNNQENITNYDYSNVATI